MKEIDTDLPCTDFGTRMRNNSAKIAHEHYHKNKRTMINLDNNEQIDVELGRNLFSVLEVDAKRINVGDVLVYKFFHYTITKTNNDVNDGFVSFRFTRTGPMMPRRRRYDLDAVPVCRRY